MNIFKKLYIFPIDFRQSEEHNVLDFMRTCPSSNKLFPEKVRKPLRNFITGSCPRTPTTKRLRALDFQASNADHLRAVYDMGITMVSLGDGKVRLFHSFYNVSYHFLFMISFVVVNVFWIFLRLHISSINIALFGILVLVYITR